MPNIVVHTAHVPYNPAHYEPQLTIDADLNDDQVLDPVEHAEEDCKHDFLAHVLQRFGFFPWTLGGIAPLDYPRIASRQVSGDNSPPTTYVLRHEYLFITQPSNNYPALDDLDPRISNTKRPQLMLHRRLACPLRGYDTDITKRKVMSNEDHNDYLRAPYCGFPDLHHNNWWARAQFSLEEPSLTRPYQNSQRKLPWSKQMKSIHRNTFKPAHMHLLPSYQEVRPTGHRVKEKYLTDRIKGLNLDTSLIPDFHTHGFGNIPQVSREHFYGAIGTALALPDFSLYHEKIHAREMRHLMMKVAECRVRRVSLVPCLSNFHVVRRIVRSPGQIPIIPQDRISLRTWLEDPQRTALKKKGRMCLMMPPHWSVKDNYVNVLHKHNNRRIMPSFDPEDDYQ